MAIKSRAAKLFSNTAIFAVGKFVSKLIVIFMLPFYTSCLSSAEYGTADLITNLCNLIIPIACLGVSEGIFRGAAAKSGDKETFFTNGVVLMLIGSAVLLALSPLISLSGYFADYAVLILLYVIASNIHSVCSQYICAIGRTKLFAGQGILNTAITVILNIIFLLGFDMGITGYVLSIVLADFLSAAFVFVYARLWRAFKIRKISREVIRDLLKFCLPLIPSTVFWWITGVSDRYLVAYICSDEMNGLYTAAYKIPTLLTYVVIIFNDAWKLSAVSEADNIEECANFYSKVFKYYLAVMFIGGGAIALTSGLTSRILFAEEFHSAWIYIPILSAATVFTALDTFLGSAYFTVKRTGMSLWTSMIGALMNIALNLVFIPMDGFFGGAMGASVATLISYFAVFVIRAASMKRFIPFNTYPVRVTVNTVILCAIALIMTLWGALWWGIAASAVLLAVSVIFNGKDIYFAFREALSSIRSRKKQ